MKPKAILMALVTLVASFMTNASAQNTDYGDKLTILQIVAYANTMLPLDLGNGMVEESMSYDINNNMLVCNFSITENMFDIMMQSNQGSKEEKIATLLPMLSNFGFPNDAVVGMSMNYTTPSGRRYSLDFTEQEVRDVRASVDSGSMVRRSFLDAVRYERDGMTFPMKVDQLTTARDIKIGDDRVIFEMEVPREFVKAMDDPSVNKMARENIIKSLRQSYSVYRDDIRDNNIMIIYQYYLPGESQSSVSVVIRPVELFP